MAKVLIVEPDKVLAGHYAAALRQAGHETRLSHAAQEAINVTDSWMPDVVLLELQLGRHNGVEFLYELRSYTEWQHLPVVVNTLIPITNPGIRILLQGDQAVRAYHYKPATKLADILASIQRTLTPIYQ